MVPLAMASFYVNIFPLWLIAVWSGFSFSFLVDILDFNHVIGSAVEEDDT